MDVPPTCLSSVVQSSEYSSFSDVRPHPETESKYLIE